MLRAPCPPADPYRRRECPPPWAQTLPAPSSACLPGEELTGRGAEAPGTLRRPPQAPVPPSAMTPRMSVPIARAGCNPHHSRGSALSEQTGPLCSRGSISQHPVAHTPSTPDPCFSKTQLPNGLLLAPAMPVQHPRVLRKGLCPAGLCGDVRMEPSASVEQTQLSPSLVLTPATTARQAGSTRRQYLLCPSQDLPESEPPPDPAPGRKAAALRLHTTNPLVSPPRPSHLHVHLHHFSCCGRHGSPSAKRTPT